MTKFITSKVTYADTGLELDHDIFEFENSGAGQVTVRLRPVDPHLVVTRGTRLNMWIGWIIDDVEVLWQKVKAGRVKGTGKTSEAGKDLLELSIDAGENRFRTSPREAEERKDLTISSLLDWLFVEGAGFDSVAHNLPEFDIPDPVKVDPRATWRSVIDPFIAAFKPEVFPQVLPDGSVALWILSAREPLPEGFPATEMPPSQWRVLGRPTEYGDVVNSVDILYYTTELNPRAGEVCTIEEKLVGSSTGPGVEILGTSAGQSPAGYPRTKSWVRTEVCRLPDEEESQARRTPLGTKTETSSSDGTLIGRETITKVWIKNSGNTVPDTEVETREALVRVAGGGTQFMRVSKRRKKYVWWFNALTGKYRPVSEDSILHAEVLPDSRVKLEEASRNGAVPNEAPEFLECEHEHVEWHYGSNGIVTRLRKVVDKLAEPDAIAYEYPEEYPGRDSVERTRPTATYLHEDLDSIEDPDIGMRPRQTFDGRMFGLELSMELVDRYIFALSRDPLSTCQLEPAPFSPSSFRGELFSVDPDDGSDPFFAITTSERQRVDRSNKEKPTAETQLTMQRLPVAV